MPQILILCPVYNDDDAFNALAADVEKEVAGFGDAQFSFLVVNDGARSVALQTSLPLTIVHLRRNLGHQKAIALGLAYAVNHLDYDHILIMDGDGEDRASDIRGLVAEGMQTGSIVVGRRTSRQEGRTFVFFYECYKFLFRMLTGKKIAFGNFMLLPKHASEELAYHTEIWNHLAGAVVKSRLPYSAISTRRGKRYKGNSKMNFQLFLLHGLGAIGVFIDVISIRLLLLCLTMILLSVGGLLVVLAIKLFTQQAIPGWATTAFSSALIILLQSFLLSLFTIFLYFSFRGQRNFIPALHYMDYIRTTETADPV